MLLLGLGESKLEQDCFAKPISVSPYFAPTKLEREKHCAEADKEMGQKMQRAAMAGAACCDDLRSALRSQVQRSPLSSFVFFQSQCGTFPVLLFPFLQQNKPFFPSLFTFEAGIRQANAPGACPVLSCFVQRARIIRTCVLQLITCVQRIKPHFVFSFFENLLYLCRNLIFS